MTYAIKAPARYAQGAGELANLGRSAKKLGNKFLVICTDNSRGRFGAQVEASLAEQEKEVVFTTFHGEATKDEVFAKMDECRAQGCDVVVGMGGGKAIEEAEDEDEEVIEEVEEEKPAPKKTTTTAKRTTAAKKKAE